MGLVYLSLRSNTSKTTTAQRIYSGELSYGKKKRFRGGQDLIDSYNAGNVVDAHCHKHLLPAFSIHTRTVTMMTGICVTLPSGHGHAITKTDLTATDLTAVSGVRGYLGPTTVPRVRHQIAHSLLCPWPRTPRTMAERRPQNLSIGFH